MDHEPPAGMSRAATACFLLCLASVISLVVLAPQLKLGGTSEAQVQSLLSQVQSLKAELLAYRAAALSAGVGAGAATARATQAVAANNQNLPPSIVPIDMFKLLGTHDYFGGISFDIWRCGSPIPELFPSTEQPVMDALINKFKQELVMALSEVLQVKPKDIDTARITAVHFSSTSATEDDAIAAFAADPRSIQWADALSAAMVRFVVRRTEHGIQPAVLCDGDPFTIYNSAAQVGMSAVCPGKSAYQVAQKLGYHATPYAPIDVLAHDMLVYGVCTKHPSMQPGYGAWLKKERMFNSSWTTFDVKSADQDHVVFLMDVLYEKLKVFSRQYWLGVITMQNPFDLMSISDIIYTTKPDLLIETGTANGGSALMWSSVMELSGLEHSKVLTIDIAEPSWDLKEQHWGGAAREDPRNKTLWHKHVQFVKGSSVDPAVLKRITDEVAKAKNVMVILDSNHDRQYVKMEMETLCKFVTVGSYCIVEDTKMSRWSSNGPLESVFDYVKQHPEFHIDRSRELLFSHHVSGYLKKLY